MKIETPKPELAVDRITTQEFLAVLLKATPQEVFVSASQRPARRPWRPVLVVEQFNQP